MHIVEEASFLFASLNSFYNYKMNGLWIFVLFLEKSFLECFEGRVWLKFLLSIIRFFKKSPRHPDTSKVTATIIIQSHQLYSIVLRWNSDFLYLKIVGKLREFFLCKKPKQTRSMASSIKISKSFNENDWICAVCISEFFRKVFCLNWGRFVNF